MDVHETSEPEHIALVKDRAGDDLRPRCVAPGVWSLVSMHKPGIGGPMIPNRSMLYRVRDAEGRPILVVCNVLAPDKEADEPMGTIRRFAEAIGATVGFIINPGPEHHLVLAGYASAFPDARVLVAAGRLQRENPALFDLPNVEALPPGDAVPELAAMGLHIHVWGGLMEGAALSLAQFRFGAPRGTAEPVLLFHQESRTLLNGGHGWWFWGETAPVPCEVGGEGGGRRALPAHRRWGLGRAAAAPGAAGHPGGQGHGRGLALLRELSAAVRAPCWLRAPARSCARSRTPSRCRTARPSRAR
jgi:hypothetical protein